MLQLILPLKNGLHIVLAVLISSQPHPDQVVGFEALSAQRNAPSWEDAQEAWISATWRRVISGRLTDR